MLLESGGDNLAASFSRELADLTIYVIDVAGGDKIPRKVKPHTHTSSSAFRAALRQRTGLRSHVCVYVGGARSHTV